MTGGAVALQHAVAVAENFDAVVAVEAAAFGIGDALVGLQGSLLGTRGQLDGFIRGDVCRVEEIKIRRVKGQQLFIGHAGVRIRRGVSGDIQRRLHRAGNGIRAEIGRRRAAFAILVIHRDPKRAIAIEFYVLHFAIAGAHADTGGFADRHFGAI